MVASITFKLRSSNHVGIIDVPSRVISCREIKEAIAGKLSSSPEEIDIFVSGCSDYLHPDEELPAYSVVEVVRHIAAGKPPPRRDTAASIQLPGTSRDRGSKNSDASSAPLTEEERLKQLSEAVGAETGIDEVGGPRMRQMRGRHLAAFDNSFRPPPPGYICHNCGKRGHLIQHCPAAKGPKGVKLLSLPTGIPETMLIECTMSDPASKFVTRDGRLVKRRLDNASFTGVVTSVTNVGSVPIHETDESEKNVDDDEGKGKDDVVASSSETNLLCGWDNVLAKNAMKSPCCGSLFCEACFNEKVEEMIGCGEYESLPLLCPRCNKTLPVTDIVPAIEERKAIDGLSIRKRPRE